MEITRTAAAGHVELKLKGRLDAIWSEQVGRALADCVRAGEHVLALDMAEVDYISSAGIRILVMYTRQLKAIHGQLAVVRASEAVRTVLQLVGLGSLLQVDAEPTAAPAPAAGSARRLALPQPGAVAEAFELEANASLEVDYPGDPAAWLAGRPAPAECVAVDFPARALGLGLGVLGAGNVCGGERLGEFLAAGGAAICQPADGTQKPDYLLLQGSLTPTVQVAYGLVGRGSFGQLLRFDKGLEQSSLPLSAVIGACLEAVGSDAAGLVMAAETAALVGAAMQKTPAAVDVEQDRSIFAFPDVRDWLSFTAEGALANTTSLIVGLAARATRAAGIPLLKPLVRSGELYGHFHAAAFPYRPLRKGKIDLPATVSQLFESEHVLGLLHLLNDWRPANGAGESRLLRGACWCAPLKP